MYKRQPVNKKDKVAPGKIYAIDLPDPQPIEALSLIHIYAKRQLTWFRRQNDAVWLYLDEEDVTERACTLVRAFLHNEE